MLSHSQRFRKIEMIDDIADLNKVPKHLQKKWWNENNILIDSQGNPVWPVGKPEGLPYKVLCALHKEFIFWTIEPVGIYKPENLGKVDMDDAPEN
jgi:hypothetical protein